MKLISLLSEVGSDINSVCAVDVQELFKFYSTPLQTGNWMLAFIDQKLGAHSLCKTSNGAGKISLIMLEARDAI